MMRGVGPPATPLDVLKKANARDEVGYVHGGQALDWPGLNHCLAKGWLVFLRQRAGTRGAPKRSFYRVTASGKAARTELIQAEKEKAA